MHPPAANPDRSHTQRWGGLSTDSDAAAYSRTAYYVALALAVALALVWLGAGLGAGSLGFKAHVGFFLMVAMAVATVALARRALHVHDEEFGDLEFSIESASARQVAAESALLVYRDMLQEAGIGWYRLDPEGHLVTATQATVDLLGYASVDQMRDAYVDRIFPASEHRRAVLSALRAVGEVRGHTASWPTAQGDILQVRDSARTIRDHEGKILFIEGFVAADSWSPGSDARLQRLEAELASARAELQRVPLEPQASENDLQYVAHMSHELRTPLNAIIGATSLLDASRMDRSQRELIDTLKLAGDNLISVVDNTLDFSRLQSQAFELELASVDARTCIEDTIELVSQQAADRGLELAYRIADDIPEAFLGDAHRVRQILSNLLSNAVRFTPKGEILVRLDAEPEGDGRYSFHFSVRDTGIGIPADRRKRLFEPYYQADAGTSRRFGGSGLGLAIARLLVEKMDGRIWVESEPGAGSTFHFVIPARPAADPHRADARPLAGLRALLLDDHSSSRATLTTMLESLQLSVNATNRSDLTVDLLRGDSTFDLVVISLESAVNAVAFASRLRSPEIASQLPIVLVVPAGATTSALPLARSFRISKPLRRNLLVETLLSAIGPVVREAVSNEPTDGPTHGLSVLVAEDDAVNGRIITRMIEKLGHRATLVDRGDAVAPAVLKQRFDLLLLDVRMPGMTGPEAARDVRDRLGDGGKVPRMIGMTASSDAVEQRQCLEAGMHVCLLKPITPQVLAEQMVQAVNARDSKPVVLEAPPSAGGDGLTLGRWIDSEPGDLVSDDGSTTPTAESPGPHAPQPEPVDPVVASIRRAAGGRFHNDRKAVAGALSHFEREAPGLLRDLSAALDSGDYERLSVSAARLKDESNTVGLSRLAALCKALEATGRGNPRPGAVMPFVRAIQAAYEEARPALSHERVRFENPVDR